jgi:hypothetical protein
MMSGPAAAIRCCRCLAKWLLACRLSVGTGGWCPAALALRLRCLLG